MTILAAPPPPSRHAMRAHALKNHLSVIRAVGRLLEHDLAARNLPSLARAHEAARRMSELINDDLATEGLPVAANLDARHEALSVDEVVCAARRRVEDRAAVAGVQLIVECGGGLLHGDAADLTDALVCVLSNAIEATPPRGLVTFATAATSAGEQQWVVQDTGCGMGVETLAQLGRPFRSQRRGATGLGMAIAREIVRRHGGVLHVESTLGHGTTITIWLPLHGASE